MSLTDKVAAFIHKGHQEMAAQVPGVSAREIYEKTKDGFMHDNPKSSVTFQLAVRIGDLYQPNGLCCATFGDQPVLLMPFERYMVYSISSESSVYDMLSVMQTDDKQPEVKCIILKYDALRDGLINVEDIKGVFCTVYPSSIFALLEYCRLVGNLKHLIT